MYIIYVLKWNCVSLLCCILESIYWAFPDEKIHQESSVFAVANLGLDSYVFLGLRASIVLAELYLWNVGKCMIDGNILRAKSHFHRNCTSFVGNAKNSIGFVVVRQNLSEMCNPDGFFVEIYFLVSLK